MSYMWIVGAAERENRGRERYIFIQIPLGGKGQKARAECTRQEFSVFSLCHQQPRCWALRLLLEQRVWA